MKNIAFVLLGALITVASCTTTKITSSWKAPNVAEKKFKNVLVLGIMRDAERPLRQKMESHMVGDLKQQGYYATSALEEYGPKEFDKLTEKEAILKMRNSGIDAVVTIVMLDKKRESRYVAGSINQTPYSMYYNRFYGYYSTVYDRIYMPNYYSIESTKYFLGKQSL